MKDINNKLKKISQPIWILILIILIGTFLRTYHFHDWLRFNMDQGRDAILVQNVVDGHSALPLLGPRASGTRFKLGPVFYYFQITSAKIFGDYPDKLAYPDLIASILAIPLLFLFLRKYFDLTVSLLVTAVFSSSYFIIEYSRYAWNPNSTPFWTILSLYSLHNLISKKNNRKTLWAVIAGIAIGVVIQLHTMSLFFFIIITAAVFGYLYFKKINFLKYLGLVLIMMVLCNVPQFIYEFQTHGKNSKEFSKGVIAQLQKPTIWSEAVVHNSACWTENNVYLLTGYEISNSCELKTKNKNDVALFIAGLIFILGGILIGVGYCRQEKDWNKKSFLTLVFFYMFIAYILGIFLADELVMRYFVMMVLFPFIFLGLWLKFLREKFRRWKDKLVFILVGLFVVSNVFLVGKSFTYFVECEKGEHAGTTIENVTLKEIEGISEFIVNHSNKNSTVYVNGKSQLIKKMFNSINFFTTKENIKVLSYKKSGNPKNGQIFYLAGRNSRNKRKMLKKANPSIPYILSGRVLIFVERD